MIRVFVYGTLKQGGSNHGCLDGQHYLGPASTGPGYTLYSIGDYPGMVRAPEDRQGVTGELWEVDEACLGELDRLEGVSEKLYERVRIQLQSPSGPEPVQAYLYLPPVVGRKLMGADWPVGPAI